MIWLDEFGCQSGGDKKKVKLKIHLKSAPLKLDSFRIAATLELSFGIDNKGITQVERWEGYLEKYYKI